MHLRSLVIRPCIFQLNFPIAKFEEPVKGAVHQILKKTTWRFRRNFFILFVDPCTLQGTNISHLGQRKIIFKMPFLRDMLVPWRVFVFPHNSAKRSVQKKKQRNTKKIPRRWDAIYDLGKVGEIQQGGGILVLMDRLSFELWVFWHLDALTEKPFRWKLYSCQEDMCLGSLVIIADFRPLELSRVTGNPSQNDLTFQYISTEGPDVWWASI